MTQWWSSASGSGAREANSNDRRAVGNCGMRAVSMLQWCKGTLKFILFVWIFHTNIWSLINVKRQRRLSYFITVVHDFYQYGYLYLTPKKFNASNKFKNFKLVVENQVGSYIKMTRSNGGDEYTLGFFKKFCISFGIVHQVILPYTIISLKQLVYIFYIS